MDQNIINREWKRKLEFLEQVNYTITDEEENITKTDSDTLARDKSGMVRVGDSN
jgi:hypothetical protein